jgi:hypothetical protein
LELGIGAFLVLARAGVFVVREQIEAYEHVVGQAGEFA